MNDSTCLADVDSDGGAGCGFIRKVATDTHRHARAHRPFDVRVVTGDSAWTCRGVGVVVEELTQVPSPNLLVISLMLLALVGALRWLVSGDEPPRLVRRDA